MADSMHLIQANLDGLHQLVRRNEKQTEDAEQRRYEASIEFQMYHRQSDMERATACADQLTRLEDEYGVLWTRINALYAELQERDTMAEECADLS